MDANSRREALIYLAGLVDGEGSITVHGTAFSELIRVAMCDREGVDLFAETFESRVTETHSVTGRIVYSTLQTGKKAVAVLEELLPFLRVKNKQAQLVIELRRLKTTLGTCQGRAYTDEQRAQFFEYQYNVRSFNSGKGKKAAE